MEGYIAHWIASLFALSTAISHMACIRISRGIGDGSGGNHLDGGRLLSFEIRRSNPLFHIFHNQPSGPAIHKDPVRVRPAGTVATMMPPTRNAGRERPFRMPS